MPLQDFKSTNAGKIALWYITEDETSLAAQLKTATCPQEIISEQKRLEWISGRLLIAHLATASGLSYQGILKDEYGKPFLKGSDHHISLSHSYPYVAAQIHPLQSVGIDIEQPKEKLLRIAPRILDPAELENAGNNIVKHCIYWCAKEALYKVYGKRGLLFTHHLHVNPFELKNNGILKGCIESNGNKIFVELNYLVSDDYVLVHSNSN